jgi:nicotinate phosphoribosyltransferase
VKYEFRCRTPGINFSDIKKRIVDEIEMFRYLGLILDEVSYLSSLGLFKDDYLDYLSDIDLHDTRYTLECVNGELKINITGPWENAIFYEVPLLAIINELYFENQHRKNKSKFCFEDNLFKKTKLINSMPEGFKVLEFGTRRRFSHEVQENVIENLLSSRNFQGTSNVYLAEKYNLKPVGTIAHEAMCVPQAIVHPLDSQKYMLQAWADEYRGKLGIALTDTLGVDKFLNDFDMYFTNLYTGVRHDSGDPIKWMKKIMKHYGDMGVDPRTKTVIFSDGLTVPIAIELYNRFCGQDAPKMFFAIGTNFTNDCGYDPLNIVIKLTEVNGRPVAKISDSYGKLMCNDLEYVAWLKKSLWGYS